MFLPLTKAFINLVWSSCNSSALKIHFIRPNASSYLYFMSVSLSLVVWWPCLPKTVCMNSEFYIVYGWITHKFPPFDETRWTRNMRILHSPCSGLERRLPWTMLCCPHCSMLSTVLFSIFTPDRRLIQAQQCWTILLTTLNNVGSTTLLKAVFINPEQVVRFLPCTPRAFFVVCLVRHVTHSSFFTVNLMDYNDVIHKERLWGNRPFIVMPMKVFLPCIWKPSCIHGYR